MQLSNMRASPVGKDDAACSAMFAECRGCAHREGIGEPNDTRVPAVLACTRLHHRIPLRLGVHISVNGSVGVADRLLDHILF